MPESTFQLTGQIKQIDGKKVLLCDQFPFSGIGDNNNEAFASFASCLYAYMQYFPTDHDASQCCIVPPTT